MIVILTGPGMGFPNGTASTARVTLYARGLIEQGKDVYVLCLGPSEYPNKKILNQQFKGVKDGIPFEYSCGTTLRGRNRFQQSLLVLMGLIIGVKRFCELQAQFGVEAALLYSDRFIPTVLFWVTAKLCKSVYISERSEMPFLQLKRNWWANLFIYFYTHTVYKLYDGVIVISNYLYDYMKVRIRADTKIVKIPILVNLDSFADTKTVDDLPEKYVAYCGEFNQQKDGILTLIKAFSLVCAEFPGFRLVLIGDSNSARERKIFTSYVSELGITNKVIFTGSVSRDEVPKYLIGATVLALARPSSLQANAGFPTKLGEFLATGKPVIMTRVGEITKYLDDGINAFLIPPDNVDALAESLRYVFSHPEQSIKIGQMGQGVAFRNFDYRENGKRLSEFIRRLGK